MWFDEGHAPATVGAKHKRTLAHIVSVRTGSSATVAVTSAHCHSPKPDRMSLILETATTPEVVSSVWCLTPDILTVCKYGLLLYCLSKHHSTGPADDLQTFMKGWEKYTTYYITVRSTIAL